MAIKPCKECGGPVSDKADSCPKCGAKVKKMGLFLKIILGFIAFLVICGVIGSLGANNSSNKNTPNTASSSNSSSDSTQSEVEQEPKNWMYDSKKDELHGTTTKFAGTLSTNVVNFDFPYNGGSELLLTVRKNHEGTDVYITISKGQFVCGVVDGCDVAFKFDDGKIMNITMVEPDSHASDTLFVRLDSTEQKIIDKLKTSKKLIIAPKFYQYGDVQFMFDVSNYKSI